MLAYCHTANITPAPPRNQNTISPAIGAIRINPPPNRLIRIVAADYPLQSRLERGKGLHRES